VYVCRAFVLTVSFACCAHAAEVRVAAPSLRQLAQKSGYIFAGTVVSVKKIPPAGPYGVATMQVSLRVDQAIRGVKAGQVIAVREWIGLWSGGVDRYRPGEQMLLFLYGRSKLGLTSPVMGSFGRFEIDSGGEVVLDAARIAALAPDPVLKIPLRGIPQRSSATVGARDFRRAVARSMENER
jgi:hypothetical protein